MTVVQVTYRGVRLLIKLSEERSREIMANEAELHNFQDRQIQRFLRNEIPGNIGTESGLRDELIARGLINERQFLNPVVERHVRMAPAVHRPIEQAVPQHQGEVNGNEAIEVPVPQGRQAPAVHPAQIPVEVVQNPENQVNHDDNPKDYDWAHGAVLMLIEQYIANKDTFRTSTLPKIRIFNKIAGVIHGTYPPLQGKGVVVQNKWRRLVKGYSDAVRKKRETGQDAQINFKYFEEMKEAMAGDPRYEAPVVAAAGFRIHRRQAAEENIQLNREAEEQAEDEPEAPNPQQPREPPVEQEEQRQQQQQQPQRQEERQQQQQQLQRQEERQQQQQPVGPQRRVLRHAAVNAMQELNEQVGGIRQELQRSNDIQQERNTLLQRLLGLRDQ